jgi:HTH-type transcriptional regulator/antitoxin HipB
MHPVTTPAQVGQTLAARRKQLGLSQTDVAGRLGLSQNRLSELESQPETMTVAQLLGLLNILGLDATIAVRSDKPHGKVEW